LMGVIEPSEVEAEACCRVSVFVDWQNTYKTARDAFGLTSTDGQAGNVSPHLLCRALARARLQEQGIGVLERGRIYTGRASQVHDKKTYAANRRQFAAWTAADDRIEVIARTLDYKLGRPREKGIDVQLAIDVVRKALFEEECAVAIVVSADTDLVPALELVVEQRGPAAIEVATWSGPYWSPQPLAVRGQKIRQHKMSEEFYGHIADQTDYAIETIRTKPPRMTPPWSGGSAAS
jgi:uncharacterized LabA/DUF88 family protein